MATRMKEKYLAEAVPALQQKFGYKNVMEIPKLEKIVINMGLGDCKDNAKSLEVAVNELTEDLGLLTSDRRPNLNLLGLVYDSNCCAECRVVNEEAENECLELEPERLKEVCVCLCDIKGGKRCIRAGKMPRERRLRSARGAGSAGV